MVELLVLACLDQLLFVMNILYIFFTEQATWRSTVLSLPFQLVFPGLSITNFFTIVNICRIGCLPNPGGAHYSATSKPTLTH